MSKSTLAKTLRRTPTPAETRFWRLIRPIRQVGWHFRKQAPMGRYVVDFVCHHARLVVEIDGDSHFGDDGVARDTVRTAFLVGEGYRVLRFTNRDVLETGEAVHDAVMTALGASGPTPSRPPPSRGR